MSWIAQTAAARLDVGARMYIHESMYSPGLPRPPYQVGDGISIQRHNMPFTTGRISGVGPRTLEIMLADQSILKLSPTPPNAPPPSIRSDIPLEDWTVVP